MVHGLTIYQLATSVLILVLWFVPEAESAPAGGATAAVSAATAWFSLVLSLSTMAARRMTATSARGQQIAKMTWMAGQFPYLATTTVNVDGQHMTQQQLSDRVELTKLTLAGMADGPAATQERAQLSKMTWFLSHFSEQSRATIMFDGQRLTSEQFMGKLELAKSNLAARAGTSAAAAESAHDIGIALLTVAGVLGASLLITWILFVVFWRLFRPATNLPNPTKLQKRLMQSSPEFMLLYSMTLEQAMPSVGGESLISMAQANEDEALANLAGSFGALGGTVVGAVTGAFKGIVTNAISIYPYIVTVGAIMVFGNLFVQYTDSVVQPLRDAWQCNIQPLIINYITLPVVLIAFVLIPLMTYGFSIFLARVMNILQWGWARVLLTFAFFSLSIYAGALASALSGFILSLVQWIDQGVLTTAWPATHFLEPAFAFVALFFDTAILPTCQILNYIIGGIGQSFAQPALALAVGAAANLVIYTLQELLFQLVFFGQLPVIEGFNDLTITTLDNLANWVENVTVLQFDIWIDVDLVGMVNGSVPLPTDGLEYLVRFLQSDWVHLPAWLVAFLAALIWEALRVVFYTQDWFTLQGANFWTFAMIRVPSVSFFDALGSMVNTLPNCAVETAPEYSASQNIKFGQLISGSGRAVIAMGYITINLAIGELYSLLNGHFPGYSSAEYFYQNGSMLNEYSYQVNIFSQALGCTVALLDPGIGNFIQGLWNVVFLYGIQVPVYFFAFVRVALENTDPGILNGLDSGPESPVAQLEREALRISGISELLYRFQNADSRICDTDLGFFCSLGKALEKLVEGIVRAFILLLKTGINIVRVFLTVLTGKAASVIPLDISGFVNAMYTLGCRAATAAANIIPFQLTCLSATPNLCAVKEFNPVPFPQTPTICLSTVACRVGNYLGVLFDVGATNLQFGNQILLTLTNSNENFSSGASKALVLVLRTYMSIFVNKILSPLCPFAHYLDCWLDAIGTGLGTPISKLFCLVNSFFITYIKIIGDTVISIVELVMYGIRILFGGATVNDFTAFISTLFVILGTAIQKLTLAIIGLLFGFIVDILSFICRLICLKREDPTCPACENTVKEMRGQQGQFFKPDENSNYLLNKKRGLFSDEGSYTTANVSQMSEGLKRALGLVYDVIRWNATSGQLYTESFSRNVDMRFWVTHLATFVAWTIGTDCWRFLRAYNGTADADIPYGDRIWIDECVTSKGFRLALVETVPWLAWLPEDIFYNPMKKYVVLAKALRYFSIVMEWMLDRKSPADVVMSPDYQVWWSILNLNTTHYGHEFAEHYPGANLTETAYAPFNLWRGNLSLTWYENRNLPNSSQAWMSRNATGLDYVINFAQASQGAYLGFSDWLYQQLMGQYNYSQLILNSANVQATVSGVDPQTNMSMSDGSMYSFEHVYVVDNQSNVRSTIWSFYGDEAVDDYDDRQSTTKLWAALHSLIMSAFKFVDEAKATYGFGEQSVFFHDYLDNSNYLQADNSTVGNGGINTMKRSLNFDPPKVTVSHVKRFQEIEKNQRKLWDAGREDKNETGIFTKIWQGVKQGYAEAVDQFMVNNGVAELPESQAKKRTVSFEKPVSPPKTRGQRILVATTAAVAATWNISTSYVPKWCQNITASSPAGMKELCNTSDWRHALGVFGFNATDGTTVDLETLKNQTSEMWNETGQVWTNLWKARSPRAEAARMFSQGIAEAVMQFGEEVRSAASEELDIEEIPQAVQRVLDKRRAAMDAITEKRLVSYSEDASLGAARPQKPARRTRETYLESVEKSRKWKQEFFGHLNPNDQIVFDFNATSELHNSWVAFVNEENLLDPSGMRMAMKGMSRDDPMAGDPRRFKSSGTPESLKNMMPSVARAVVRTLNEFTLLSSDQDAYKSLFVPTHPEHHESALLSDEVATDNYIFKVRSKIARKRLYEAVTGNSAPVLKSKLPQFELRTYQEAYLRQTPRFETRTTVLSDGSSRTETTEHRLGPKYEMLYSRNGFRSDAKSSELLQALKTEHLTLEKSFLRLSAVNATAASRAPRIVFAKNVQELRMLPPDSHLKKQGFGIDAVFAEAQKKQVESHFFFPTDEAETLNLARRVLGCRLGSQWLCENCILIDYYIGTVLQLILTLVSYYTKYFPVAFVTSSQWLSYGFNNTAQVLIGNFQFPARWPARTTPTPFWYRGILREIENFPDDGPKWTWFVEDRLGVPLPTSLYLGGPYNTAFQAYLTAAAQPGFDSPSALYGTFKIIQDTLGWNLPALFDTIFKFIEDYYSEIATAAYQSWKCNYTTQLDCSTRTYSFAGGAILLFTGYVYVLGFLAFVFPGPGFAAAAAAVLVPLFPYLHSYITYGAAFGCFPWLPQCYVTDMWTTLAYVASPKCSPIWGGFVSSANYNLQTCTTCRGVPSIGAIFFNNTNVRADDFTYVNCFAYGFQQAYDGFTWNNAYYQAVDAPIAWPYQLGLWVLNGVYDLGEQFLGPAYGRPAQNPLWSEPAVQNNWRESDAAYANYWWCSQATMVYGTAEAMLFLMGGYIVAVPLLSQIAVILIAAILFLGSVLSFLRITALNTPLMIETYMAQRFLRVELSNANLRKSIFAPMVRKIDEEFGQEPEDQEAEEEDSEDNPRFDTKNFRRAMRAAGYNTVAGRPVVAASANRSFLFGRLDNLFPGSRRQRENAWEAVDRFFRG